MGAYLSEPVTKKISSDESGKNVAFGASSMQGWRVSQEDAHNCCIDFDEDVSLFAVYDGHGGHEVAAYCASKLPEFIKETEAYQKGDIRQALIDAFLGFDATLAKPEVIRILKEIAGSNLDEKEKLENDVDSDDEDNVTNLRQEAEMPLEQVMAKYRSENLMQVIGEEFKEQFGGGFRCRRNRERGGNTSGASCSSSSWTTNEADVSSSSQSCSTSGSPAGSSTSEKREKPSSPCSSEVEQVLDSTTSNGEVTHAAKATKCPAKSSREVSNDSEASNDSKKSPTKAVDMPDSSADVKEKVSPSKTSKEQAEETVGVNGSKTKSSPNDDAADVERSSSDVSSSSTLENGEVGQQEGISSSSRRLSKDTCYRKLLRANMANDDDEDDDDDDDDDENDETFDGMPESLSEDDTEDMDDEADDSDSDPTGEDEEEDLDEEEEEEEEEDEEDDFTVTEEPGSDSGCTAVVAILKNDDLFVANAGDSRCVLCRGGDAVELSLDHKPEDEPEMKRIVAAGGKVTADGRVNGGLNLSRALGDHAYKQNTDIPAQDQMISALPDIRHTKVNPDTDEFMVLACDGIWNYMSSGDVIKFVRSRINSCKNLSQICEELFDHCLAPDTVGDGTGCDNMTAVIVKFKSSKVAEEHEDKTKINPNKEIPPPQTPQKDEKEVSTAKKRPLSPSKSVCESDDTVTNEHNNDDDIKRAKIETV